MNTTQDHIPIKDISDDGIIFLKDGSGALAMQVSAVNFGLLSEREQYAIIGSFAQMLNSLSSSIQILIYSKKLNISSYLRLLDKAKVAQKNPLLSQMITSYRDFVQTLIKENEVLDKKFYVIIPLFRLELGLVSSKESLNQKIKTVLLPRRDQVVRALQRAGLKATQLSSERLVELFFEIYNEVSFDTIQTPIQSGSDLIGSGQTQPTVLNPKQTMSAPILKQTTPAPAKQPTSPPTPVPITPTQASKSHPFVVEELEEV